MAGVLVLKSTGNFVGNRAPTKFLRWSCSLITTALTRVECFADAQVATPKKYPQPSAERQQRRLATSIASQRRAPSTSLGLQEWT
jgi:hypothetical protein